MCRIRIQSVCTVIRSLLDSVGEGKGVMVWENGIETHILSYVKRIAGLMGDTGCLGLVHWDDPERWDGKGGGRGFRMGNTCTPVADSCQCMTKPIQCCKVISLQNKERKKEVCECVKGREPTFSLMTQSAFPPNPSLTSLATVPEAPHYYIPLFDLPAL